MILNSKTLFYCSTFIALNAISLFGQELEKQIVGKWTIDKDATEKHKEIVEFAKVPGLDERSSITILKDGKFVFELIHSTAGFRDKFRGTFKIVKVDEKKSKLEATAVINSNNLNDNINYEIDGVVGAELLKIGMKECLVLIHERNKLCTGFARVEKDKNTKGKTEK